MGKSLVIVESPAKAKTIARYLEKDFIVKATVGHIKNLPKEKFGVDIEGDFEPQYEVMKEKTKVLEEIRKAVKSVDNIYLASDPDREGEAIAVHIFDELKQFKGNFYRLLLNEITKPAILKQIANPGQIDFNKYNAQQARRVLDRVVGYKLSPLLWDKVKRGLSAGRVQSVAVRLVCEREDAIKAFKIEEYWSVTAELDAGKKPVFLAKLLKISGKKATVKNEKQANTIKEALAKESFVISSVEKKERKRKPVAPFITSTLQQEAARKLGFSSKKTMMLAQQLYEGIELKNEGAVGLITYMRTDSVRVSPDALDELKSFIVQKYGQEFLPKKPHFYGAKKKAVQDAHEAIRPTLITKEPSELESVLSKDQFRLYDLIWKRLVASQMSEALFDSTSIDIKAGKYLFRANGSVMKFPGFQQVYLEGKDDEDQAKEEQGQLPAMEENMTLKPLQLELKQHFTEPPARYSDATLVKALEENGIGRPSTYASIMSTIVDRNYAVKDNKRYHPTPIGTLVNELLVGSFPEILNVDFTAQIETVLDHVAQGTADWKEQIRKFYKDFSKSLAVAQKEMRNVKTEEIPTDIPCPACQKKMVQKWGRNGMFLACGDYPNCKKTAEMDIDENGKVSIAKPQTVDEPCELCGGEMVIKTGKYGRFLACANYPDCRNTRQIAGPQNGMNEPAEGTCDKCGGPLVIKMGRYGKFTACADYPNCKFIKKNPKVDTKIVCPTCSKGTLLEKKSRYGKMFYSCSTYPECKYAMWDKPVVRKCSACDFPLMGIKETKRKGTYYKCPEKNCGNEEPIEETTK